VRGTGDVWAVLPVKEIDGAKSRLAPCCSSRFRRALARAMLEDVLSALMAATGLAGIVVVTADPDIRTLAIRFGARAWEEDARAGHTQAVMAAARRLAAERRAAMLTVPADIPGVTAAEVSRLLAIHGEAPAFTIVPSHDRRGSNAIVVSRPDAVQLAFGDDSFVSHLGAARRAGLQPTIIPMPGIGLDIDRPVDLLRALQVPMGARTTELLVPQRSAFRGRHARTHALT
jgi:2-phospho-L-lactate guanylyltransferase